MKFSFTVVTVLFCTSLFAQTNIQFRSQKTYPGKNLANIGGYVDGLGNEYALVGTSTGLSIVDVTNPATPVEKFAVVGPTSDWREVKTWGNYAYVTTEGGASGLQIINMTYLPDSVQTKFWMGDGAIANQLETIHALHIDNGFVYLYGSNLSSGTALMANLSDPWNPTYSGKLSGAGSTYVHDGYVRNDTLWSCHIYDGSFKIYNVANKANPVLLATQNTPSNFTHNAWLNDAGSILFTTDEVNNSYLTAYDVSDINNIKELDRIQRAPGSNAIVHNTHILNDYAITSWYKEGVVIHDVSRAGNMIEVGNYDTSPLSGGGFDGCWGVYPYLPSGTIVASDISQGLFVLTPTYVRGCYLEGIITDTLSGVSLNNVKVEILTAGKIKNSNSLGEYKTGLLTAGSYSVQYSKPGYITKVLSGVALNNGVLNNLNVQLMPIQSMTINGQVKRASNNASLANATVHLHNIDFDFVVTSDVNGNFSQSGFFSGTYDVEVGKWGQVTYCASGVVINNSTGSLTYALQDGYYDDFSLDFNWITGGNATSGAWVKGVPIGTTNAGQPVAPGSDVTNDCGNQAFVTGNGGGSAGSDDVDNGNVVLTSPVMNLSSYVDPYIHYSRWFVNTGGATTGNDTLTIKVSDGTTTALVERVLFSTPGNGTWVNKSYRLSDFITPGSVMRIIVETADWPSGGGHLVEAGLDLMKITEGLTTSLNNTTEMRFDVYPNPNSGEFDLAFNLDGNNGLVEILDMTGRVVYSQKLNPAQSQIKINQKFAEGMYMIKLTGTYGSGMKKMIITK